MGLILLPNFAPAYFTYFWNRISTHRALLLGYGLVSTTVVCFMPIIMKKLVKINVTFTILTTLLLHYRFYKQNILLFRCLKSFKVSNWVLLHVICLLELGIGLLCVSMHNFSLGYLTALVYVLPAVCTKSSQNG